MEFFKFFIIYSLHICSALKLQGYIYKICCKTVLIKEVNSCFNGIWLYIGFNNTIIIITYNIFNPFHIIELITEQVENCCIKQTSRYNAILVKHFKEYRIKIFKTRSFFLIREHLVIYFFSIVHSIVKLFSRNSRTYD